MVHNDIQMYICDNNKKGGNKFRTYRLIKNNIIYEPYINVRNLEKRKYICNDRTFLVIILKGYSVAGIYIL